jgi:DNA-binding FadR family transcriptional regulator
VNALSAEECPRNTGRRNLKTSERIARDIANYIVNAHLPKGAKLPGERALPSTRGRASGSVILRVFSDTLQNIASGENFGIEYRSDHRQAMAKAHERILAALRKRRPRDAEKAMGDRLQAARRQRYIRSIRNAVWRASTL